MQLWETAKQLPMVGSPVHSRPQRVGAPAEHVCADIRVNTGRSGRNVGEPHVGSVLPQSLGSGCFPRVCFPSILLWGGICSHFCPLKKIGLCVFLVRSSCEFFVYSGHAFFRCMIRNYLLPVCIVFFFFFILLAVSSTEQKVLKIC